MFLQGKDDKCRKINKFNGSTGHAQEIGISIPHFPNCLIINPVGPFYYCPGHLSNTISLVALKVYVIFQKVTHESLEHCDFFDPQGGSWRSPYQIEIFKTIFKLKLSKSTLK